jgi:hypothetical protein
VRWVRNGWNHIKASDTGILQGAGANLVATGRGSDKASTLLNHEVDNIAATDKGQGNIDAKGLVGKVSHFRDFRRHVVQLF